MGTMESNKFEVNARAVQDYIDDVHSWAERMSKDLDYLSNIHYNYEATSEERELAAELFKVTYEAMPYKHTVEGWIKKLTDVDNNKESELSED